MSFPRADHPEEKWSSSKTGQYHGNKTRENEQKRRDLGGRPQSSNSGVFFDNLGNRKQETGKQHRPSMSISEHTRYLSRAEAPVFNKSPVSDNNHGNIPIWGLDSALAQSTLSTSNTDTFLFLIYAKQLLLLLGYKSGKPNRRNKLPNYSNPGQRSPRLG
jgi:hypothetical protein